MIYFDNAATSYQKPASVYRAVYENMIKYGANASRGGHSLSLKAGELINEARLALCDFFEIANPERLAFFQNATAAINTGIKGVISQGDHVITTQMEHNSVIRPLAELKRQGKIEYTQVKADENGKIDANNILKETRYRTKLIVMSHVSNVCGNIYDVETVGKLAKEKGIIFMIDAAQSAGVLKITGDMADMFAFSGHKSLMGMQGTGGLYIREGLDVKPLLEGGTGSMSESLYHPDVMPDKFECGTQNMAAISSLTEGVKFVKSKGIDEILSHEQSLSDYFTNELKNIHGITVYGDRNSKNKTGIVSLNIDGKDCNVVSDMLSTYYGIATRSGLHCAPSAHKSLGTLEKGTIRFSFGIYNTKQEIDKALYAIEKISKQNE